MREEIIQESIISLRQEGLRFSVDTLAERLKISKKTVYKYFPDKEALAFALYETYYDSVIQQATLLSDSKNPSYRELLLLYFDSKVMTRSEIFNKYKLNKTLWEYADKKNEVLWAVISSCFPGKISKKDSDAVRAIVDGTFEKLCNEGTHPEHVIERLVTLL